MRYLSLFQPALLAFIVSAIAGCGSGVTRVPSQNLTEYHVMRTQSPIAIDADWNKSAWKAAPVIELTHFMGTRPEHFPRTRARFAYDDHFLYVIFKVDDRYVRAATPRHQGETCRDSCVEFFFSPGMDISAGYFNIEMNCGGTMLFNFQREAFKNVVLIRDEDLLRIESAHTQPRIVDPEIAAPVTWTVEYRLPIELLTKYLPQSQMPAPGMRWRANVYKCADNTSHPHWLTWAPVDFPTPNFHLPQYFGTFVFD